MEIAVLEDRPAIKPEYLSYLEEQGHLLLYPGMSYAHEQIDAIMVRRRQVDQQTLDKFPRLQRVLRVGVGTDHIDLAACEAKGVDVITTPGANAESVAELAIWGALSVMRTSVANTAALQRGHIDPWAWQGTQLAGRSIGLIGYGHVGQAIRQKLTGFGCGDIYVYDPYIDLSQDDEFVQLQTLEDLLLSAQVVFLAVPLTDETMHMIGAEQLRLLQPSACLVNVGRGGLVDEAALVTYLQSESTAAYYGDVREGEPTITPALERLLKLDNVVMTTHLGAATREAEQAMHRFVLPA